MYHYLFLFTGFLFFMVTKSFKVYMYVYIKFCDVAYSYLFVLICACTVIMLLFYTCLSKKKPYKAYVISCL